MKQALLIAFAISLAACSSSEEERTREQARQTAEQAGKDAKVAAHDVKVDAERASKELDKDLHKAREKVRGALNQPADTSNDKSK
jgi:cytochrome c biogenesis protein ResB